MTTFMKPFVFIQIVIFLLLLSNGADLFATNTIPVVNSIEDNTHAQQSKENSFATSRQNWQIKPGENIFQIAQSMYPDNTNARKDLVRAIIKSNPQFFPNGVYQPIPAGTVIYLPDLQDIGSYAKPAHKKQNTRVIKQLNGSDNSPATIENNDGFVQRMSHLEQDAENNTHDLNKLNQHIDTLSAQIAALQLASQRTIQASSRTESAAIDAIHVNNVTGVTNIPDTTGLAKSSNSATTIASTSLETNISPVTPETLIDTDPIIESESPLIESLLDNDLFLLTGLLLALLLVILLLRRFRSTRNKHSRHEYDVADIQPIERHGLGGLSRKKTNPAICYQRRNLPIWHC